MNIKSFFTIETRDGRFQKITISEKFNSTLFEIFSGRKTKFMSDLATNFGFFFRKLNLEKTDPLVLTMLCMLRNLKMLKPPDNIKSLLFARAKINHYLAQRKTEEAVILSCLFENCYRMLFRTNTRDEIQAHIKIFCSFFEEMMLHARVKNV